MKVKYLFLAMMLLKAFGSHCQTSIITTVAGNGTAGYAGDGGLASATTVELQFPAFACTDNADNLYFVDGARIRRIDHSTGVITTVGGNGTFGYLTDGVPATSTEIAPDGVTVDAAGSVYFCEGSTHRIRKIGTDGIVSTIAGTGTLGTPSMGVPATSTNIGSPGGPAVDAAGNIYFTDGYNKKVYYIDISGNIQWLAGNGVSGSTDGPASAAEFSMFQAIAVDYSGNVYVSDYDCIRKISSGTVYHVAGVAGTTGYTGDGGAASGALLGGAASISFDPCGNLFFSDPGNFVVRKINTSGIISTYAGNGTGGFIDDVSPTIGELTDAVGVAHNSLGDLFICDQGNKRIRKVTYGLSPTTNSIAGTSSICIGSTATLSISGGTPGATVTLAPSGSITLDGSGNGSTTLSPTSTTSYTGTVNLGGCAYPVPGTFTVTVSYGAPTSVSATASPNPICVGSTLSLAGAATGATSYSWSGPGSFYSSIQNPTIASVSNASAGVYLLTATNGCGSGHATANVVVVAPSTSVTASASPNPICAGSTLSLSGSATGATSYSWSGPNSFSSTLQNPNITSIGTVSAGVYTLTASNACGNITATTAAVAVDVTPTITSTTNSICQGTTLTLSVVPSASGGTWTSSAPPVITVDASGVCTAVSTGATSADTSVITYSGTNSCGSFSITKIIKSKAVTPSLSITGTATPCMGTTVAYGGSPFLAGGYITSSSTAATVDATTFSGNPTLLTVMGSGLDTLTYHYAGDDNHCPGSYRRVITLAGSFIGMTITGPSTIIACSTPGSEYSASGTGTTGGPGSSGYHWSTWSSTSATINVSPAIGVSTYASSSGVTTGLIAVSNGVCSNNKVVSVVSGGPCREAHSESTPDEQLDKRPEIYPNPTDGTFILQLPEGISSSKVTVLDIAGKKVLEQETHNQKTEFNLNNSPSGLYFISVTYSDTHFNGKLIKE